MKWEMEMVSSYLSNASWVIEESTKSKKWSQEENKMFENALAVYDKDTPDRWQKVAAMIPGKTVGDVIRQYKQLEDDVTSIEAGLVPIPPAYNYDHHNNTTSAFTLEWNGYEYDDLSYNQAYNSAPKRRPQDHERKKGVPWTEEEHKLFLMGLKKYGKGDWRNISRNFVVTRTPTQVASHAQKYFLRQLSGGKDKRRASIHDITTVNLDNEDISLENNNNNKRSSSPEHMSTITRQPQQQGTHFQWDDQQNNGAAIAFDSMKPNMMIPPYGVGSYGFQIQPPHHYSHG